MLQKGFKKGFTLVELIIVIAVIAILAIFALPNFVGVLGSANASNVKNDTATIQSAVKSYVDSVGAVPVRNINADKRAQGVSAEVFEENATAGKYYLIDFSILGTDQDNINDGNTVKSFLSSMPATSAIASIATADGAMTTAPKIKNTSVVYVIDKNYDVFAVALSKPSALGTKTAFAAADVAAAPKDAKILEGSSTPAGTLTGPDKTFKAKYLSITDPAAFVVYFDKADVK